MNLRKIERQRDNKSSSPPKRKNTIKQKINLNNFDLNNNKVLLERWW